MPSVIQLPPREDQTAFNLRRWEELIDDPYFARIEGRIETDRHGNVIMSPPPSNLHGRYQFWIGKLLQDLLPDGLVMTECAISTEDGVRAADVAWLSSVRSAESTEHPCLLVAPEICVEVLSPSNSREEMREKTVLYFSAGAREVWWCERDGTMRFFTAPEQSIPRSALCPDFPVRVQPPG